jgi:plasmid stabilization system protein ParE
MSYVLQLQTEAILDIKEAFDWYEEQRKGLGDELLEEIEECYNKLREHPQYYTYLNNRFRRIKVKRFPYLLIYEIEDLKVIVNSLHHAKRKPID